MSSFNRDPSKVQPAFTFLGILIIGIIFAIKIVKDTRYTPWIIFLFLILGMGIAGMELAAIIRLSEKDTPEKDEYGKVIKKKKDEYKTAKLVAQLFDEDIPFDEIEKGEIK